MTPQRVQFTTNYRKATPMSCIKLSFTTIILFFIGISLALADAQGDIDFILQAKKPPGGVVFEIVEGDESQLQPALDLANHYIRQLKAKLPTIKIAIVSHGSEQFALLKKNRETFKTSHKTVRSLLSEDVDIHVCGTHAQWRGYDKADFPDYVDVAVAGPAKIREYQRQGYALIEINAP